MGIYLEWGFGWYYVIAVFLAVWLVIMRHRKDYNFRAQAKAGITITAMAFVVENIAVSQGLWNYDPGNWPLILWPSYFISALAVYQIAMLFKK